MLTNFIYICFKLLMKASGVGLSLFSLHLYTRNFACKRIKSKPSSVVVFPSCLKRISVGLIENLAQLKLFSFKHISNLTQKDWMCSHWHIKWKIVYFSGEQQLHTLFHIVPDNSHILQNWVCHKNSVTSLCLKPSQFNFSNFFKTCKNFLSIQCPFPAFFPNSWMH